MTDRNETVRLAIYSSLAGTGRLPSEAELVDGLSRGDAEDACRTLMARVLTKGARDNVTAIVVHATAEATATQTRLNPVARRPPDHNPVHRPGEGWAPRRRPTGRLRLGPWSGRPA